MIPGYQEIHVLPGNVEPRCETFCGSCGQLRLWCKPEPPAACGNCGAPAPLTGPIGGSELMRARAEWWAANGQGTRAR